MLANDITYENIKVSTFDFTYIKDVKIENEVNNHNTLFISGIVDDEVKDLYLHYTLEETPIVVYYENEDEDNEGENILFNGIVTDISIKCINNLYKMSVKGKDYSYLLDVEKKTRSFQNTAMTNHQLIDEIMKSYPYINYEINIAEEPIGRFLLQYKETDFEFLKRVVSIYKDVIISNSESDSSEIKIGLPKMKLSISDLTPSIGGRQYIRENRVIDSKQLYKYYNYTVSKDIEEYIKAKEYDNDIIENDFITYSILRNDIKYIGDRYRFDDNIYVRKEFQLDGREYFIKKASRYLSKGTLESRYEIRNKKGIRLNGIYNKNLIGISIFGTIAEVSRDKVKVNLEIDEEGESSNLYWFPYASVASSPDGGGWYCMPEIGERVRLNVPGKDETKAFVINSIDEEDISNAKEDDRMANPQDKSLQTDSGQEVKFTESGVAIESNGGEASMNLNKDGTVTVVGQKSIEITCGNTIEIRSENNINILAEEDINIKSEAGGEIKMPKGEKILFNGKKIHNNG